MIIYNLRQVNSKKLLMKESNEKGYIELELPEDYQKQKLGHQMIRTQMVGLTLLSCSFLVQEMTNVKVVHESIIMLVMVTVLLNFINYNKDVHNKGNRQLLFHTITISTIVLGLIGIIQFPNYGIFLSSILFMSLYHQVYNLAKKSDNKSDLIIFLFGKSYLILYFLSIDDVLAIDLTYFLIIPNFIFLILAGMINCFFVLQFIKLYRLKTYIYTSPWKTIMFVIALNFIASHIVIYSIKYLSNIRYYQNLISILFFVSFIFTSVFIIFFKEILIFSLAPKYTEGETAFRIGNRQFIYFYKQQNCNRNLMKLDDICLLCQQKAVKVIFDCGHLTLCQQCYNRYAKKDFYSCILCNSYGLSCRNIQQIKVKRGYNLKIFIQKKLYKNQYLMI